VHPRWRGRRRSALDTLPARLFSTSWLRFFDSSILRTKPSARLIDSSH
jgi:hypothetical protein